MRVVTPRGKSIEDAMGLGLGRVVRELKTLPSGSLALIMTVASGPGVTILPL
jgi:hypothetical protein